jgi:hypothetical protein
VHRPLVADVVTVSSLSGTDVGFVRAFIDGVGLTEVQDERIRRHMAQAASVPLDCIDITYSHTHSGGVFWPDRVALPGGDLIEGYVNALSQHLVDATKESVLRVQPVTITYGKGSCAMAANRDYYDDEFGGHTCGFNPDAPADDTLLAGRITDAGGNMIATMVNYACHPTSLAWDNTLISPDYPGALRAEVERVTSAPCIFAQGACGDLGPRWNYSGNPQVADRNGRMVGLSALAILETLDPPGTDFRYLGPVISGATLGAWDSAAQDDKHIAASERFAGGSFTVDLPLKPAPDRATLEDQLRNGERMSVEALARGDTIGGRDARARAERARRWLARIDLLPTGTTYAFPFSVYQLGDAVWVTTGGEPYNVLQVELRRRFPQLTVLVSPLAGGRAAAYLLPLDRYGKGLYQEEPSSLAPGCLEQLIEAVAARIAALEE